MMANVILPNIFSDHMVLQRNTEVSIWGWGNPKEEITVVGSWDNHEYKVVANNQAKWQVTMKTPEAGGPYSISIKGYNEVVLNDILIGEVWLCSGQSNMEMSASWGIENGDEEMKKANYPNIRFFTVPKLTAETPQNNLSGNWSACTPETMKYFSAVGYFFGKRLQEELKNVPIGLISSNWGGTPAEIWMPEDVVQNDENLLAAAKKLNEQEYGPRQPGRAFNAMINPIVGFEIAGVLWYQGESNVGSKIYDKTLEALIASWREKWKQEFPFYIVQIAPFKYGGNGQDGVVIRDLQRKVVQNTAKTALVVTSDIAHIDDIHPKDKKSVGVRLANLALSENYKANVGLSQSPLFKSFTVKNNLVEVTFDHAESLHFSSDKNHQFELAGTDGLFFPGDAMVKNNKVIVTSKKVKHPTDVRFAWKNTDLAVLFNKANLPASSFSSKEYDQK
ncbi:sialate O-acetylesterase [Flavobacterium sp. SE-1-e]|uniref:Sialate O-acetylesterase n=2 Tax=Flavobacterium agrisoli TaxID=2793066 RepID=A0A934PLM9_9FLAO|nr:sialate O-acetylesterase [Flavobacterium agrisoli]